VYSVSPDTTVYDALKLMAEKEIGAVVVLEEGKMVGIMSERDYARKIILKGKSSKETRVREIMTSEVIHVNSDKKVGKCLSLMTKNRIRHIPVLEKERLVGILSIEDVKGVT
jgi:CBS domain-containing protein